jgi:hypothetical protein
LITRFAEFRVAAAVARRRLVPRYKLAASRGVDRARADSESRAQPRLAPAVARARRIAPSAPSSFQVWRPEAHRHPSRLVPSVSLPVRMRLHV